MNPTIRYAAALAVPLLVTTSARAAQYGPGPADIPLVARTPEAVERELAQIDAQLDAQLAAAAAASAPSVPPATTRTPLGAPPPDIAPRVNATALIDPDAPRRDTGAGLTQTVLALGGVLLVIGGLAWGFKRLSRASGGLGASLGAGGRAPAGLVEVLARYPIASRQTLVVLRFDRRVLLCSMAGGSRHASAGMSVLCELEDPEDVASVLIKARDQAGESMARSFERSLRDAEHATDEAFTPPPVRFPAARRQPAPVAVGEPEHGPLRRGLNALRDGGRP